MAGLRLLIKGLSEDNSFPPIVEQGRLKFDKTLFASQNIIPEGVSFYFFPPGVKQVIRHTVFIPEKDVPELMQIGGSFYHEKLTPHWAARIFAIPIDGLDRSDAWVQIRSVTERISATFEASQDAQLDRLNAAAKVEEMETTYRS